MKALAVILLALVGTLILNGPIQSYADPQLNALLRIATQARENLKINISQINNAPDEITHLFKQGSNETDALANAIDKKDAASARKHFLSAMNFFKTTNDKINSLNVTQVNDQPQTNNIQLQSKITRLEKIGESLKTLAVTNHATFNFTQFDQLIQKAKKELANGNIGEVSKSTEAANQIMNNAHNYLTEVAKQKSSDRAKNFAEKQTEKLGKVGGGLSASQNHTTQTLKVSPITKTSSNFTSSENPKNMVSTIKKTIEGKVDEAMKLIKSLKEHQKAKLKANGNQTQNNRS